MPNTGSNFFTEYLCPLDDDSLKNAITDSVQTRYPARYEVVTEHPPDNASANKHLRPGYTARANTTFNGYLRRGYTAHALLTASPFTWQVTDRMDAHLLALRGAFDHYK